LWSFTPIYLTSFVTIINSFELKLASYYIIIINKNKEDYLDKKIEKPQK